MKYILLKSHFEIFFFLFLLILFVGYVCYFSLFFILSLYLFCRFLCSVYVESQHVLSCRSPPPKKKKRKIFKDLKSRKKKIYKDLKNTLCEQFLSFGKKWIITVMNIQTNIFQSVYLSDF